MSERGQSFHADSWLSRALVCVTSWVARHPWPVLVACLVALSISVYLAATRLQYRTQRDDLMAAEKACQVRWRNYLNEFGPDDDIVFVIEGSNRTRMEAAVEYLAILLRAEPQSFDRVFDRVDLRQLRDRSLLYLSETDLRALDERLEALGPLLHPASSIAWQGFTLHNVLLQASAIVAASERGVPVSRAEREFLDQLATIASSAAKTLGDANGYVSPWDSFTPADGSRDHLAEPRYFFSADGTLAFLLARPAQVDRQSFTPLAANIGRARALMADAATRFPDLAFGLTGLPVLENDEMAGTDRDSLRASLLALAAVAMLYLLVYRGLRYPLLTVGTLVAGTVWSLGLATLAVGHLNILSSSFAVMLIGLGDFGVLWVARFDEEYRADGNVHEALKRTAALAGPGILTAAATVALAFYATMLADFQAVAELGFIAGSGVLLCALACFLMLPALLVLTRRRPCVAATASRPNDRAWMPGIALRPRLVLAIAAVLFVAGAFAATRLRYDSNLLHMQSPDLDSVQWEKKLLDRTTGTGWHALSVADTPEQAVELRKKYEQLPGVGRVEEVASLIPPGQDRKLPMVARLAKRLHALPPRERAIEHPPPNVGATVRQVESMLAALERRPEDQKLHDALRRLKSALVDASAERIVQFERRLSGGLWDGLHQLKAVATPRPIGIEDLPQGLRERFIGKTGKWLVRAYARDNVWDHQELRQFVRQARSVDPEATGKPFGTLEGLRAMKRGFQRAGLYALAAIVFILLLDFRSGRCVLLGLLPLLVGVVVSLGLLSLFDVPINPANLIALPLIVGVGVDNGVHVLHDYLARKGDGPYRLSAATARGILVAALTTMLGFGAMVISRHQGMRGLGVTLTLGVGCCMAAALVVLPAVLRLIDRRAVRRRERRRIWRIPAIQT